MNSSDASHEMNATDIPLDLNGRETGWRSWLSIPKDCFNGPWATLLLVIIAWGATSYIRYAYIEWADTIPQFKWEGVVQPTTHDAFTHGAMIEQHVDGRHGENPNMYPLFNSQGALHVLSWAVMKTTSLEMPQLLLWAPVFLGSMMAIPLVLLGRVFGSSLWGFTSALLGAVAFNYYERSMAGYFDTDLFSFWIAMLLVYFLIAAHEKKSILHAGLGAVVVFLYPFFYAKGLVIGSAIAGCYLGLQLICILFRSNISIRLKLMIPVALAASFSSWSHGSAINESPLLWLIGLLVVLISWWVVSKSGMNVRRLSIFAGVAFVWLLASLPWNYFVGQVQTYSHLFDSQGEVVSETDPVLLQRQAIADQIDFRKTHKYTVKESQGEAWSMLAQRITGSVTGTILALIGYMLLCLRYPGFLTALPLAAIGLFSFDGGLRFTTWGGVIAAPALIYMIFIIIQTIFRLIPRIDMKQARFGTVVCGMLLSSPFIAVNFVHAHSFKVSPVFNNQAILAMEAIRQASKPGDYVMSWWDYGSGIWYYSGCNVLMTPISASNDCWTISEIVTSDSQRVAAGLSAMATNSATEGHLPAADHIFGLDGDHPIMPSNLIAGLADGSIEIPECEQDVFLYMPLEMLPLIAVVEAFSNPEYDLPSSPKSGYFVFIPPGNSRLIGDHLIRMSSGVVFNTQTLKTFIDSGEGGLVPVKFNSVVYVNELPDGQTTVSVGPTPTGPVYQLLGVRGSSEMTIHPPGEAIPAGQTGLNLVILSKSGSMMVVSDEYLNSNAIQMVALQKYDRSLWELVYKSAYARVFKLRKNRTAGEEAMDTAVEGS